MYELSNNKPGKMSLENIASKLTETTLSFFLLFKKSGLFVFYLCLLFIFKREREGRNGARWVEVGGEVL